MISWTWLGRMSLLVVIGSIGGANPARADLFVLRTGGQVEGELLNPDEKPRESYVVKTQLGGQLTFAKSQVERVVVQKEAEQRYDELLPKMHNTVDDHAKMADWCQKNKLDAQRQFHLREILKLDPENETARHGLGYSRIHGKWYTVAERMQEQGYVRYKGDWRLPDEIEIIEAKERGKQAELDWKRKVNILRNKARERNGERALEELRNIRDPAAAGAIIDLLNGKNESHDMRMLYLDILGQMQSGVANGALILRALQDEDDSIRDKALDWLERSGRAQAVRAFVANLRATKKDPLTINRAGIGLGRMKEPEATPALIDSLITRQRVQVTQGGQINPVFNQEGGGGLNMGGKPKFVEVDNENQGVLAGLTAIHPGVTFGFDKAAWKQWWIEKNTPKVFELRRDK